jgi:small subunit ribosomal protein S4
VRRTYGILERQFHREFDMAARRPGKTSENLLQILEMRLDNLVYRLGFADSRAQARQLVCHGHFAVNGRKTDIPSFIAKPNDVIAVRERSKGLEYFKTRALLLAQKGIPAWLSLDIDAMSGRVISVPSRTELELPFDEQMVVEFYQR